MKHTVRVVFLASSSCVSLFAGELVLNVPLEELSVRRGDAVEATASISNKTAKAVVLVLPGDGSASGWRTPITGWSFLPAASKDRHPQTPPPFKGLRCGNMNSLRLSEVFTLKPSETKVVRADLYVPHDLPVGRYRVVFYFVNDPKKKFGVGGMPLSKNDPGAERLVAESTACKLISNESYVNVTE